MEDKFHLPALGIVTNEKGQILLIQRNEPETHTHLKWAFPGGRIDFGEHPIDTVVREVQEETGITVNVISDAMFIENLVYKDTRTHILCLCYPAKYIAGEINFSNEPGIKDVKWFNIDEINFDNCLPKTKEILDKSLKYL